MVYACLSTARRSKDTTLDILDLPLQAEVTISKLTEEGRLTAQERESIRQELVRQTFAMLHSLLIEYFSLLSKVISSPKILERKGHFVIIAIWLI